MTLTRNTYGKARVRVMRVHRTPGDGTGEHNDVRELTVQTMLEGDFAAAYEHGDNRSVIATDTIKNITYVVAREHLTADAETFAHKLAARFLERYEQIRRVVVNTHETKWLRANIAGLPHPHSFVLDPNGTPTTEISMTRGETGVISGIAGFTFMKSTASGWVEFVRDEFTTLPDTTDRIAATAMDARWEWSAIPVDYTASNNTVLRTMIEVFATTYSRGIQDSLYRMGEAALAAVPELASVTMACPNKHYLPVNLHRFAIQDDNTVFIPTDEPHGQIECTVAR